MQTTNAKLKTAKDAIWELEGILSQDEILRITGLLQGKSEGLK